MLRVLVAVTGTPNELKSALGGNWLDIVLSPGVNMELVAQIVKPVATGSIRIDTQANRISIPVTDRTRALVIVATALSEVRIEPEDLALRRPTLDEVFLYLTGSTSENSLEAAS